MGPTQSWVSLSSRNRPISNGAPSLGLTRTRWKESAPSATSFRAMDGGMGPKPSSMAGSSVSPISENTGTVMRTCARIDDDGLVRLVDRKKDMINRGGENVYCVEVENALAAHPAVGEVAVVGVPDEVMGEKVGAVVVPRPGAELDPTDLAGFARERLADFKVPQYVAVRADPLPRNAGGKVLKPVLRDETSWGAPLR